MKGSPIRPPVAISLCILFAVAFAIVATAIVRNMIGGFDRAIIDAVQGWEAPRLTSLMQVFTAIGGTKVVMLLIVAVTAFLLLGLRARGQAYFFFFATIGTGVLNQIVKFIFKRARPEFHRLAEAVGYSFPSGHTMMSFSLYALFTYLLWGHIRSTVGRVILVIFSFFMFGMIAVSRIYLGVHYPSDILGGVFASAFWLTLSALLFEQFQMQRKRSLVQQ
ncbi:phosphatase PAP2 family protein [Sporosarcina koreensis]|uniref:Phosphatase PAP2 family protein n=1 Tax=Sporosarcina koreensis TaxID=334735 RepID=A0ABW0TTT5_9BACL